MGSHSDRGWQLIAAALTEGQIGHCHGTLPSSSRSQPAAMSTHDRSIVFEAAAMGLGYAQMAG